MIFSVLAHVAIGAFLCWPVLPIFVSPQFVALGEAGTASPSAVALYFSEDAVRVSNRNQPSLLSLPVRKHAERNKGKDRKRKNVLEAEKKPTDDKELGSAHGSSVDGPASGDEVRPALPVAFHDLHIPRTELPYGVQGDVIVEITIDVQGNVTEEKLLQGLGGGVDDRVIAALRDWRFTPATRNGVAIPSKHDVHFHFPS